MITRVKRYVDSKTGEIRIYIETSDGREGCFYASGNRFQARNTREGTATKADWAEARRIAYDETTKRYTNYYADAKPKTYAPDPDEEDLDREAQAGRLPGGFLMTEDR